MLDRAFGSAWRPPTINAKRTRVTTRFATFGSACAAIVPRGAATDFWNRYREDIELARGLGCTVFRLSLSWAQLEPQPGVWSDDAFAHYRDVLQALRDAGMSPIVTLVHNTWPLHVQAAGSGAGPLDPAFPDRVARFAAEVAQRLGDLIDDYVTLNEPDQLVYGWIKGFWMRAYAMPPGQPPYASGDEQMDDVLTLIPNLFRAHAKAREAIRQIRPDARVGTNPLVLGLPRWIQRLIDRNATHLQSPSRREAPGGAYRAVVDQRRRTRRLHDRPAHHDARAPASTPFSPSRITARISRRCTRVRWRCRGSVESWARARGGRRGHAARQHRRRLVSRRDDQLRQDDGRGSRDAAPRRCRRSLRRRRDASTSTRATRSRSRGCPGARSTLPSRWRWEAARCSTSSTARFASCDATIPRFPTPITARRSRTSGARRTQRPTMRATCRIWIARSSACAKRGKLRVGIHPGVPGCATHGRARARTRGWSPRSRARSRS